MPSSQRDLGRRALFASVGGGILVYLGAMGFQGKYGFAPPVVALAIGVALILASQRMQGSTGGSAADDGSHTAIRSRYLLITRLEYAGFAVALVACQLLNQRIWLVPLVALISGIHYVALGPLLRSPSAYVKGVALCLIAVVVVAVAPAIIPPHAAPAAQTYLWWVLVGLIGGGVLWADALLCLVRGLIGRMSMLAKAS